MFPLSHAKYHKSQSNMLSVTKCEWNRCESVQTSWNYLVAKTIREKIFCSFPVPISIVINKQCQVIEEFKNGCCLQSYVSILLTSYH